MNHPKQDGETEREKTKQAGETKREELRIAQEQMQLSQDRFIISFLSKTQAIFIKQIGIYSKGCSITATRTTETIP